MPPNRHPNDREDLPAVPGQVGGHGPRLSIQLRSTNRSVKVLDFVQCGGAFRPTHVSGPSQESLIELFAWPSRHVESVFFLLV